MNVISVVGTRPNFVKLAPVHRAMLASDAMQPRWVHTAQHYDWEMTDVFIRDLALPAPDFILGVGPGTHAQQTAEVMQRLEPLLIELRPDVVVVFGDVNSTFATALTAVKLRIPVAHVEAGLRSYDRSMPEEINRELTDAIASLLFAPSEDAVHNLEREGIGGAAVRLVGNVMIDTLDAFLPRALESPILRELDLEPGQFLLATVHRPSNVDSPAALGRVNDVLHNAARVLPLILVAHPRTRARLVDTGLLASLADGRVRVVEPLGYIDFLGLMAASAGVLTDSGGIQEETTVLGLPCLTLREHTERPITVTQGTNTVVGLDPDKIDTALALIARGTERRPTRPPLWDGHTAERIVTALAGHFGN